MKESLFTTPHKEFGSHFTLAAKGEIDHQDAIKCFRSSASIESIIPRMSVKDDLLAIQKKMSLIYKGSNLFSRKRSKLITISEKQ